MQENRSLDMRLKEDRRIDDRLFNSGEFGEFGAKYLFV
jgi:hypothetical protein